MRLTIFEKDGARALGVRVGDEIIDVRAAGVDAPADISGLLRQGPGALELIAQLADRTDAPRVKASSVAFKPLALSAAKTICLGLNYVDHAAESGFSKPDYPTVFFRCATSFCGHGEPMLATPLSDTFDYEGELVAFLGGGGRNIPADRALELVAGYSVFNDGSIREYQVKSTQWTVGKNFDATGGFGPDFVTADELPRGADGLKIETRLNGTTVQSASTSDMIFGVAETIALMSQCFTLEVGDILVMGTPAGVGNARDPKLFMHPGDVCEVEIERIGLLRNPIAAGR